MYLPNDVVAVRGAPLAEAMAASNSSSLIRLNDNPKSSVRAADNGKFVYYSLILRRMAEGGRYRNRNFKVILRYMDQGWPKKNNFFMLKKSF